MRVYATVRDMSVYEYNILYRFRPTRTRDFFHETQTHI
jgi:hypothetical protein